jgi:hypothetical protein
MRAVTAAALIIIVGGLWISAYFREITGRIRGYFSRNAGGFPRTRKRRK